MPKIHVLVNKEHVDARRLPGKVVVVLDVLFATTSIVTALANGAVEVIPTMDRATALAEAQGRAEGSFVLAGELNTRTLEGFTDPWPRALMQQPLPGRTLIYSTTNGTVALTRVQAADHVYAGSLLNGDAIVDYVDGNHHDSATVLIVCSGSDANMNLEDFYGAGYLVSLFARRPQQYEFTDAAQAAWMLHDHTDALGCMRRARVGRMMRERGLDGELEFSAQKGLYAVVPKLAAGSLRAV